jgi:hypothetical protein
MEKEKKQREKEINELREKMEKELNQIKEGNGALNKRIQKLEINQLLLYHQISMFQTSRDIYKSIFYYYFEYLGLNRICKTNFDKLKAIMDYIVEKDENKMKSMQYLNSPILQQDLKQKLGKYFKLHFFVNKVINKIVHRNFEDEKKRIIEEQKDNELLPLIPSFDFDQCFNSLIYCIENTSKNKQMQTVMSIVYEQKYINDEDLESIRDDKEEVIKKDENGISFLINKNEIEYIRNYFKSIKIGDETFAKKCNDKTWDQEETKFH